MFDVARAQTVQQGGTGRTALRCVSAATVPSVMMSQGHATAQLDGMELFVTLVSLVDL